MKKRYSLKRCLIAIFFVSLTISNSKSIASQPIYAVITPISEEARPFLASIKHKHCYTINNVPYTEGFIADRKIVLTTTGPGKINAATITTKLIDRFDPRAILVVGSAGGINPKLHIGDIVVGAQLYNAEGILSERVAANYEINPINRLTSKRYLTADPKLLQLAKSIMWSKNNNRVIFGLIATTDIFPQSTEFILEQLQKNVDAVDMESFAIAHVCWLFNIPCISIRSISDIPHAVVLKQLKQQYVIETPNLKLATKNAFEFSSNLIKKLPPTASNCPI